MNPSLLARFDDPEEVEGGSRRPPEDEDADPVGALGAAAQKPVPDATPKPRHLEQEKSDFTSEGSPPPGKVGGASAPATTEHEVRTQRPKDTKR